MEEFIDLDLGIIRVVRNVKARRIIARRHEDFIQLTVPKNLSLEQIKSSFYNLKPRIEKLIPKPEVIFGPDSDLITFSFKVKIILEGALNTFDSSLESGILKISCPLDTNFLDREIQCIIRHKIEIALRTEAKRVLVEKLDNLARQFGFDYTKVSINKSRGRWGSCSSKRNINLSYFCLFLPEYLIDFIILHELCHTVEMNHGDRFWYLLDKVTGFKAKALTKDLMSVKIRW